MFFKYVYTGSAPTAFITLRTASGTWVPNQGDTYDSPVPIAHPLLELVVDAPQKSDEEIVKDPAVPDQTESPAEVDESEEN